MITRCYQGAGAYNRAMIAFIDNHSSNQSIHQSNLSLNLQKIALCLNTRCNQNARSISYNRHSGRCPKLKKDCLAELHYIVYEPTAITVIQQFSKSFSTSFRPCQLHQTAFIYRRDNTEQNAVYCVSKFEILQILWDFEFQPKWVKDALFLLSFSFQPQFPRFLTTF